MRTVALDRAKEGPLGLRYVFLGDVEKWVIE
jgi:hypothetical protein